MARKQKQTKDKQAKNFKGLSQKINFKKAIKSTKQRSRIVKPK